MSGCASGAGFKAFKCILSRETVEKKKNTVNTFHECFYKKDKILATLLDRDSKMVFCYFYQGHVVGTFLANNA